jgi:ESF2/ABP1 family protein
MGGKKHNVHYYDLWCMKYLHRFKWDHLTEEINYQRAVHDQKLQAEISAAKRERDFYLSRVDKAKAVDAIIERKRKKNSINNRDDDDKREVQKKEDNEESGGGRRVTRTFGQKRAKADPVTDGNARVLSDSVLQLVAGKKQK